jgi:NDP-sugar pyrophosphorylase family protein
MKKTVLITTSGIGERLGILTKYTNKSLVNVGDKYALCYIIENYEIETNFIITIGYCGNLVKDFLLISYPLRNFTFVEIDNYVGDGSSLGYSLLQAKNFLQMPFIFHCCDAIVINPISFEENKNALCVVKSKCSKQYANVNVNNNFIIKINNKNYQDFDYIYTGISFIYDYKHFWEHLQDIYDSDKFNNSLSDVHVIRNMMENNKNLFTYIVLDDWYDTGNAESYNNLQNSFKSTYNIIAKPNESLCFFDKTVVKFINDKSINEKRVKRGNQLFPLTPKIISSSDNFMLMEKIDGDVLSQHYKYGEIYKLLTWAKNNLWINEKKSDVYKNDCYEFYINKTINRINSLSFLKKIKELNIINGINVEGFSELMRKVLKFDNLLTDTFYNFHGDFILDNIIKRKESYILIDWRHEFGSQLNCGDLYYDLAKLRHNIVFNHKNILQNLYEVIYKDGDDAVTIDLKCNYFLMQQLEDFDNFVFENNYDLKKIKIITSIIWLNMAPLYDGKLSEFLFYFGKYNLFLSLK